MQHKRRGQLWQSELGPWIIMLLALLVVVIAYGIFSDKGLGAIRFFKHAIGG